MALGFACAHVAAPLLVHEVHSGLLLFLNWLLAVFLLLRLVVRRLKEIAAALGINLAPYFWVAHDFGLIALTRRLEVDAVLALEGAKVGRNVAGLLGA